MTAVFNLQMMQIWLLLEKKVEPFNNEVQKIEYVQGNYRSIKVRKSDEMYRTKREAMKGMQYFKYKEITAAVSREFEQICEQGE